MNEVIGIELLSQSLLPAIIELSEDSKWRVRMAIIEYIPMLAEKLGAHFFNEKLHSLCISWLSDQVCAVRMEAAMNLKKLVKLFGDEWSKDQVIPRVERMHVDTSYLKRITALYCVQIVAEFSSIDTIENTLLPLVLQMAADAVPNVRFTVSKTLGILRPYLRSPSLLGEVMTTISTLCEDGDRDVTFFSRQVIAGTESTSRGK
jgi:serine/threonine-protein phosphatase 2A regulatory subunit A